MRKLLVLALGVMVFGAVAGAVNVDVSVQPDDTLWLSEDFEVTAVCEPTSGTYTVYVKNVSQGQKEVEADPSELMYDKDGNQYVLSGSAVKSFIPWGYQPGEYTFFTTCDGGNATDTVKHAITVETLVAEVENGLDGEYFAGQQENLSLTLKKEGEGSPVIIGGDSDPQPTFSATIDGDSIPVSSYYNAGNRQWVLNIGIPEEPGTHTLQLTAAHDGAETTVTRELTVQDTLQFDADLGRHMVSAGQTVTLDLTTVYQGDDVSLTRDDLSLELDGEELGDAVVMVDGSTAEITFPEKEPGTYDMIVTLEKAGVPSAEESFTVQYPVRVSGEFTDRNDNPLSYTMEFSQDANTKAQLERRGEYNMRVPAGTYNVTIRFRDATLTFRDADVSEAWDDPVRYTPYDTNRLPGLRLAGLYSFRTSLEYDAVDASFTYDAGAVNNPEQLGVYRCTGWNGEQTTCYTSWSERSAGRDEVRSRMTVDDAGEGAFAIGRRTALTVTYAEDDLQNTYTPDQRVELSGRVRGPDGADVPNASVSVNVPGTDISTRTWTDTTGTFDISFTVPEEAGTYTMQVDAERSPYRDGAAVIDFSVERPAGLNIISPETVRATANTTKNVTIYVENTGYTTLSGLSVDTDSVPFFERIAFDDRPLQAGESREAPVTLTVPADAKTETHKAELVFSYGEKEESAVFGVTVEALDEGETAAQTGSETTSGLVAGTLPALPSVSDVTAPISDMNLPFGEVILFIIALQAGLVVIVLAHGKITGRSGTRRDHVIRTVSDIKNEVGRAMNQAQPAADTGTDREYSFRRRNDGVEREQVLRAMQHIKDQLASK